MSIIRYSLQILTYTNAYIRMRSHTFVCKCMQNYTYNYNYYYNYYYNFYYNYNYNYAVSELRTQTPPRPSNFEGGAGLRLFILSSLLFIQFFFKFIKVISGTAFVFYIFFFLFIAFFCIFSRFFAFL